MAAAIKTSVRIPEPANAPADTPARGQQPEQTLPDYVVITPARNEAASLELTIGSMLAQTVLPLRWVIVSDGSTDGTDEIVARYARQHSWIELIHLPERSERDFAAKVKAFNAGLEHVTAMRYDVVVSLDADITFDSDYFSFLLGKLAVHPELGLVGTPFRELTGEIYDYRFVSVEHVSGACQVFRRSCFENIGGYVPIRGGSIDHVAVITARMKGWKTRTFTEKYCIHHRRIGTAKHGPVAAKFRVGMKDYAVGNHPLWELCRVVRQAMLPPRCIGGLALGAGYAWAALTQRAIRPVTPELIHFHRREQMKRLCNFFQQGSGFSARSPGADKSSIEL